VQDGSKRDIIQKLDLENYIDKFTSFMAREKSVAMEGDTNNHYRYIKALSSIDLPEFPQIPPLDNILARLSKQGILHLDEIYHFIKIIYLFNRLKATDLPEPARSRVADIEIPQEILDISSYFTDDGEFDVSKDEELFGIDNALKRNRIEIKESLLSMTRSNRLQEYLIDTNVHFINGEEALLVRGGFSSAIKASVIGRSSAGFFYIVPNKISEHKQREAELLSKKEAIIWRYCKEFSATMHKWERFLTFINREFDIFDHYQARVKFAKATDYSFILPSKDKTITLSEFAHPALDNPKPITITLNRPVMLITGVNAGGKTMLLKSILSAVYMSKYLLPFRCNPTQTRVGSYKSIEAIIDDPQSVKNDISTFAGRMLEFSKLFRVKNAIVGVDEIELGTDADEAASLFRVLIDELIKRDITFVVTTHHKRLASLMAGEDSVELIAALYDEAKRRPTFTYLQGSIGKSYAFETAQRYGIPESIVERAKELYGEDKERLNELIEQSTRLEQEMRRKIASLDRDIDKLKRKEQSLKELEEKMQEEQRKVLATLENRYNAATKRALEALKRVEVAEARQLLNEAHKHKKRVNLKAKETQEYSFKVGDRVKYRSHKAEILSLKSKEALIVSDGIKMRVPLKDLKPLTQELKPKKVIKTKTDIKVQKSNKASLFIKLLGMRADEAIDELDNFLSNALLHGLSEVEVIHGTGSGVLAKVVSEHLKRHPKVKNFYRMPGNMGVTVVEL